MWSALRETTENPLFRKWTFFIVGQVFAFSFAVGGMLYLFNGQFLEGLACIGVWLALRRLGEFDGMTETPPASSAQEIAVTTVLDLLQGESLPPSLPQPLLWATGEQASMPELHYFLLSDGSLSAAVAPVIRAQALLRVPPTTEISKALQQVSANNGQYLSVVQNGRVMGIVSRRHLLQHLKQEALDQGRTQRFHLE